MKKTLTQRVKRGAKTLALAGILGFGAYQLVNSFADQGSVERTRREVALAIDKDGNRVITKAEWEPVYEALGVKPTGKYGLDLNKEQLQRYLDMREGGSQ